LNPSLHSPALGQHTKLPLGVLVQLRRRGPLSGPALFGRLAAMGTLLTHPTRSPGQRGLAAPVCTRVFCKGG
jgi:hypothetical protein